jgi:hypothetical protein
VGGKNQARKQILHEGQIRSFKGDIVPGQSFPKLNAECKFYADFPFHLIYSSECKQLDSWLDQLLDVEDEGDCNVLFMKFNRIGQYIAVQPKLTWRMDSYTFYASKKYGDWLITSKDSFFNDNKDFFKLYCSDTKSNSQNIPTEPSISNQQLVA